jgi:hypothetical protein
VADLHGQSALPKALAHLLRDKVWCEVNGGWVRQHDRQLVSIHPLLS